MLQSVTHIIFQVNAGDKEGLVKTFKTYFPNSACIKHAARIADALVERTLIAIPAEELNPENKMYLQSINQQLTKDASAAEKPITSVGTEYDFLAQDPRKNEDPMLWAINIALRCATKPTKKIAVLTSIRNEGIGFIEWLAFHRTIGIEDFYVYANDNDDGSTELLNILHRQGLIHFIENQTQPNVSPQKKAFRHAVEFLGELRQYEWLFVLDADEYFVPLNTQKASIDEIINLANEDSNGKPAAISFHWKWFGSNNAYEREKGTLLERFPHSHESDHVKTLARMQDTVSFYDIHMPILLNGRLRVNAAFEELKEHRATATPNYKFGQINHYWNKSFKEYLVKKLRGRGAIGLGGEVRGFEEFFKWGNTSQGKPDSGADAVIAPLKQEVEKLMAIPGVKEQMEVIENKFVATVSAFDKQNDLWQIYKSHLNPVAQATA